MNSAVTFRAAIKNDSSDLAILSDAATRRLSSFMWSLSAKTGQSWFEFGRSFILTQTDHFSHYSKWHIAESDARTTGALNCCLLPKEVEDGHLGNSSDVTRNLNELKVIAGGTWYITAAAVFPEFRNLGIGEALLSKAENLARVQGIPEITLMVGSFNDGAQRLYRRFGFNEWERRPFIPFPGSDPDGFWILMRKKVEL
jgi:ribosomal protein S18 acetylase RimI-like enzyme